VAYLGYLLPVLVIFFAPARPASPKPAPAEHVSA
jgi:hypothetical protein